MKIETQNSAERTQLADLVSHISIAMMTTVNSEGLLTSRPMAPLEIDAYGSFWFFTDIRSEKVEQLKTMNVSFSDLPRSTYVSLSGHGEIYSDRERIQRLWTAFAKPWFPDGPDSPNLALLKFAPGIAEYWDAPNSRMVRLLALAASAISGKPVGLGDHQVLKHL